jgi:ATP-dependent HslUV protease ATP-binding subunit HslU
VNLERQLAQEAVEGQARRAAEERLLDALLPPPPGGFGFEARKGPDAEADGSKTRETFRRMLREGKLDDREVEIEISARPPTSTIQNFSAEGVQDMVFQIQDMMGMRGGPKRKKKVQVREAREHLHEEEAARLLDMDKIHRDAVRRVEESGIIFIDEIDKIAGKTGGSGPDVSREGVQRDLLPIVEGTTVSTKHGTVSTDHILFIAAGAFHMSKPSDMIPELQGRFPVRVELGSLSEEDFVRILRDTDSSLLKQYQAILDVDQCQLKFTPDSVEELARIAAELNKRLENIGARRLQTILAQLLDDLLYDVPQQHTGAFEVTADFVRERLEAIIGDEDLTRYIL